MVYHFSVDSLTTVFFQTILLCCFNGKCQRLDPCTVVSESVVWGLFGKQVIAIPAVPLTMSVGLLLGTLYGTMLVSISGTVCLFFFHNEMLHLKVLNFPFMLDS